MAWKLLFTSDIGLMSLGVIAFVIVMAIWLFFFARKHMEEDGRRAT
jgi:hypothetical protein